MTKSKVSSRIISTLALSTTLIWLGCSGSSNSGAPTSPLNANNVAKDVIQKISISGKMPAVNDYKELVYLYSKQIQGTTICRYLVDEKTTVTSLSSANIDFAFDNSVSPAPTNPQNCPLEGLVKVTPHSSKHWELQTYLQNKSDTLKKDIDTERFLKFDWVSAATIVQSQETEENGLRSQLVDIQITTKTGSKCNYRQFVSLDSVFLGRFEETIDCGSTNHIDYLQLKEFSIKGLPHK